MKLGPVLLVGGSRQGVSFLRIAFMSKSLAKVDKTPHCRTQYSQVVEAERDGARPDSESWSPSLLPNSVRTGKVMIVDDEHHNVLTVRQHLKQAGIQHFLTTTRPHEVMELIRSEEPDVVVLDMDMPEINGTDILRAVRFDPCFRRVPVIACYESVKQEHRRKAMDSGAHDVLTKPYEPHDLVLRVRNSILLKLEIDQNAREQTRLEALVGQRTEELQYSRRQLILSLARAAEFRDNETGHHVIRVGRFAAIIAEGLGWDADRVELIEQAAQLHDVGKIGIPDAILFKPGKLDPQEYDFMKKHALLGRDIIEPLSHREFQTLKSHSSVGGSILRMPNSPMMTLAARIAQTHHERWDGTGYPIGLKGDDIPIEGRITAVADVFDALSSKRPYKPAFPREKCFAILEEGRGSHFDPHVLDAFFANSNKIVEIQLLLAENPAD